MEQIEIQSKVCEFIEKDLLLDSQKIEPKTSLFEGRILDSMHLSELLDFIESNFNIRISAGEVSFRNLDTLGALHIPVIGVGGIEEGTFIDSLVATGDISLAAVGRAILKDPQGWRETNLLTNSGHSQRFTADSKR